MRKFLDTFSFIVAFLCLIIASIHFDLYAITGSFLLIFINKMRRCPSLHYLTFIFNLFYSLRYFFVQGLNFSPLYEANHINEKIGFYFFISTIFYSLIVVCINYTSSKLSYSQDNKSIFFNFTKLGKLSIILFSIPVFLGTYSIGREVNDFTSRIMLRMSSFLNYFQPFIFNSSFTFLWCGLFSSALIVFGSKAFIYTLFINYLIYLTVEDKKLAFKNILIFVIGGIISIIAFDLMTSYRVTHEFNLILDQSILDIINTVGKRFAGLDTLIAYGEIGAQFSMGDMWNELIIAFNNFLLFIKINIPSDYVPSEMRTALIFHDYDYNSHIHDLRHTDSMFGFSRFISLNYGLGLIFFLLCLIFPVLFLRSSNYYFNIISKIFFYNELIIGGAFYTIFRFAFEIILLSLFIRMRYVRKILIKLPL
jgi:hypothetical protein